MKTHLIICAILLLAAGQARPVDRLELLPSNVHLRLDLPNVDHFADVIADSQIGRFWKDPEIRDFLGHPEITALLPNLDAPEQQREILRKLQTEQLSLLRGEAAFGLNFGGTTDFYFVAGMPEPDYLQVVEIDRRIAELLPEKVTFLREKFQGTEILRTTRTDKNSTNVSWQAWARETLLESSDRVWIEKTIAGLQAGAPRDALSNHLLRLRMDGAWLAEALRKALAPDKPAGDTEAPAVFDQSRLVEALHINELQYVSFTLQGTAEKLESVTRLANNNSRRGIWSILDTNPLPVGLLLPVPAGVVSFSLDRLNLPGFWSELPDAIARLDPNVAGGFQFFLGMLQQTFGIDPENDILRHMETCYLSYGRLEKGRTSNLLCWRLKDPQLLKTTLRRLLTEGGPLRTALGDSLQEDEFLGQQLFTISQNAGDQTAAWSLAVGGGHLLIGNPDMLREFLRALNNPAAGAAFQSSPLFRSLQRHTPPTAFAQSFFNLPVFLREFMTGPNWQTWRQQWEAWRTKPENKDHNWAKFDPARIPEPDKIAGFFGPLISHGRAVDGGVETTIILLPLAPEGW
ncbi:MAG: hypothetical protein ABR497_03450 [Kiritimatiellia bacterium]|nr:hypothetical protein [Lentisphaerota bacterium]